MPSVQAALAMVGRLPPPAAGAHVLAGLDGTGAWFAADARVALVVELVVGHVVLLDVVPHLLLGPRDERVDLDELVHLVPFDDLHVMAGDALVTAQAADPCVQTLKGTSQRFQLADLAAAVAALDAVVEEVDALFAHHALHLAVVGEEHLELDAVVCIGSVDELVGLGEEPAGVEREDAGILVLGDDDVRQCLVLDGEGGRKGDAPFVCLEEKADDLFGGRIAKSFIQFFYLLCLFHI